MVWKIATRHGGAYGNGTRSAGFVFCETSAADDDVHAAMEKALLFSSLDQFEIQFQLTEGVTKDEAMQAVRNVITGDCELFSPVERDDSAGVKSVDPDEESIDVLKLSKSDRALLVNAGLNTIKALITYGESNSDLRGIQGMTKQAEARIAKAVMNYVKAKEHGS